ncbi:DNA-binding SARP family transcriptional activator/lipopolysaccharide biosynthesis regulator YciM [Actinoplanes octamycinicus]|uniref:DNA-binding SARP family transcriptional activator/lipopolysaccharide biosynthesis regulator YciM n=1 Tax=Actinoplanes octamycinicus TaxID=135948 RepID=A0A7W7H898_9ACTN|nr:BTAD domain-containing putative transcriptional regulator [Actinoplanes octamycinicus]MBB4745779.1 DNA-binding SARP family transcriptional activator/lipopolysaccharide biosynthesis regulator YciM [Actinoplanes octamycinicus]GIE63756.1 SARP family transcriptional regulator [Actinoplanes octamycinicus]
MQILILGILEVLFGETQVELGGQRQQIILATLALEANKVIRVTRLMEALYGDDLPSTSRVQVQICISALRRLFAAHGHPDAIVTRTQGYSLQIPDGALDLHRYEEALTQARQLREFRRLEESAGQYRQALALWRGPALDGVESRVVQGAAERLAERRLTTTEECIELELKLGRHREVIDELNALVDENPLRARLREHLMLALYRSGRQPEALDTYRVARRLFIDELGLEPGEELRQLEHAILTGDPRLALPESLTVAPPPVEPVPPPIPPVITNPIVEEIRAPAAVPVPPVPVAPPISAAPVSAPGISPVPCLLPTDIADFTGRNQQIEAIQAQFGLAADDASQFAVPVVVMAGKPGIGKTTLAVHAAHRLAARYPDGQLFADLHGRHAEQVGPMRVLERFLRALGVPGTDVPELIEERAELYRTLLADRRMLVVLDNAGDERQVRPLVPGTSQSAVLITSRSRLAGLPGAVHIDVDVFNPEQSTELLSRIAGAERIEAEPDSAAELAELCGHLPLALRIAGARLAARPHWSVDHLVERLENEARRLDELKHSGMGIRASISLTYDHLEEDARRLFRLLTVLDFPHFSGWVAAALLDIGFAEAQDLLDDLADAQLIETSRDGRGVHAQYRFHDLIRVFARERLAADDPVEERDRALERALGALLFLAEEARRGLYGNFLRVPAEAPLHPLPARQVRQLVDPPLPWFERERLTIVAAVRQAAQAGLAAHSWSLAMTAVTLFESRIYLSDWRETHQIALEAARQAGDERGQAAILYSLGSLHIGEQRYPEALRLLAAADELFLRAGDQQGRAMVSRYVGFIDRMTGRYAEAAENYTRALETFRAGGDLVAVAYVLHSIAQIKLEQGDLDAARTLLPEALEYARRSGSRRVEAQALHRLGETHLQADEVKPAIEVLRQALDVVRELGDPVGQAYALQGLGAAYLRAGAHEKAADVLREAMELAVASAERMIEARVSMVLGELAMAVGNPPQAVVHLHRSLGLFRAISVPQLEARVLGLLSDAYTAADNPVGRDPGSLSLEPPGKPAVFSS